MITQNLRENIIEQKRHYNIDNDNQKIKNNIKSSKSERNKEHLENIRKSLTEKQLRLNDINRETGA